jgi:uncharacterized membrane protein YgcG
MQHTVDWFLLRIGKEVVEQIPNEAPRTIFIESYADATMKHKQNVYGVVYSDVSVFSPTGAGSSGFFQGLAIEQTSSIIDSDYDDDDSKDSAKGGSDWSIDSPVSDDSDNSDDMSGGGGQSDGGGASGSWDD